MARTKYLLPPFFPSGKIIQQDKWADHGSLKDEDVIIFSSTGPPPP